MFVIHRFGQFLASTVSSHYIDENEVILDGDNVTESNGNEEVENNVEGLTPKRIRLRNVLLEVVLCLIYGEGGSLDHRLDGY